MGYIPLIYDGLSYNEGGIRITANNKKYVQWAWIRTIGKMWENPDLNNMPKSMFIKYNYLHLGVGLVYIR